MAKNGQRPAKGPPLAEREVDALFERYGPLVFRRAHYILGAPEYAERAAVDVMSRALRKTERFSDSEHVATWLYRLTSSHCLTVIRDKSRYLGLKARLKSAPVEPTDAYDPPAAKMSQIRDILASVDQDCAQAALYVHVDGMTHSESAELLGVSSSTVENLLSRFAGAGDEVVAKAHGRAPRRTKSGSRQKLGSKVASRKLSDELKDVLCLREMDAPSELEIDRLHLGELDDESAVDVRFRLDASDTGAGRLSSRSDSGRGFDVRRVITLSRGEKPPASAPVPAAVPAHDEPQQNEPVAPKPVVATPVVATPVVAKPVAPKPVACKQSAQEAPAEAVVAPAVAQPEHREKPTPK
ncbi:MAG: RNA polymerase sigma factor (sigma-70 family), partial [Myxococcota bacterium]